MYLIPRIRSKIESMKNKKILIGLLGLIAVAVGMFFYFQKRNEFKLSSEDLVKYESVYHEFQVTFLRKALDAYIANDSSKACILESAVIKKDGSGEFEGITSGLASFDIEYYKSKFIVLTIDDNKESPDGKDIQIIFRDKPDKIFYAWVGRNPEGEICLIAFNSDQDMGKQYLYEVVNLAKPSIYDERYGI